VIRFVRLPAVAPLAFAPRAFAVLAVCALAIASLAASPLVAAEPESFEALDREFAAKTRPLMARYCLGCHSTEKKEGELDLERFARLSDLQRTPSAWLKVAEMLDNGEMPPEDAKQPSADERKELRRFIDRFLHAEAHARAGDPGPVVLRRLSNAEYTYTIQDLTSVPLRPARDFPADGAAGEGFTNAGNALVMSPSLLTKYLDAGKEIAAHAVLLADSIRFSPGATRRDWTDELLAEIRRFYARFADGNGRIPYEKYLAALLAEREALDAGRTTPAEVARRHQLNERYAAALYESLRGGSTSVVLDALRARWRNAAAADAPALAAEIERWQNVLSRYQNVGHMKPWIVPVTPLADRQEIRLKLAPPAEGDAVTLYLAATEAGDGREGDVVVWQRPRLIAPGRPELLLRDVRPFTRELAGRRERVFASAARCLAAVAEAGAAQQPLDRAELAKKHQVDADALSAWLDYLGVGAGKPLRLDYLAGTISQSAGYNFVQGWGTHETPLLVANSSDQHVRIPGNMKPHGVTVHPSPTLNVAAGWKSPLAGTVRVSARVTHAHPECGNGVVWSLELRRGSTRQRLAAGVAQGAKTVDVGPVDQLAVQTGDLISLVVGPRDGNHACDLTDVELVVKSLAGDGPEWNLTQEVSPNVLAGNPHADRLGNAGVWHFYTEPVQGGELGPVIPQGSLLAKWQATDRPEEKQKLADAVRQLLVGGPPAEKDAPDAALYRQLASLGGPLFAGATLAKPATENARPDAATDNAATDAQDSSWGVDPALFGRHPNGSAIDEASLCVQAPAVVQIRLPADLVAGSELVTEAVLHDPTGAEGSVQVQVLTERPAETSALLAGPAVLVGAANGPRQRIDAAFAEFRALFPAAICYPQIVPVDEAVTLALFHREDESLLRLMLDDAERARINRLWDELHFVSHDALATVDAFAQLMEYATQDSDPRLFEPFRKPIHDRAAAFRRELLEVEPRQLDAVLKFAARAYRHPLAESEAQELRELYRALREEELSHDEAIRLTLARVFVSPAFLYRLEQAPEGDAPGPVSNYELASRLSYFLWSSLPDAELWAAAESGRLVEPDVLAEQGRRMLKDRRMRRLATEFACQWLHIYEFDALDEKSERHFPEFASLRADMYEESIHFFTDLFRSDASILGLLDADHTFLNEALAKHYGIPGVTGANWRRVDGMQSHGRGGILGLSTTLAKNSGASRTSPILRGNWVAEVLLGDKLPRPPKDVPKLPDDAGQGEGLTVRQLIEKHTADPRCSGCHARIDPLGFALEDFDAIGRRRDREPGGQPIDTHTKTQDGAEFAGLEGLRAYLLTTRREAFVKQFCRKLLGYALGRGVELSDGPLLDEMRRRLEVEDYRFSAAVETILRSRQFREIRGRDRAAEE